MTAHDQGLEPGADAQGPIRILVVDGESRLLDTIAPALEQHGYVCRTANNIEEARAALREPSFALVLTDMSLLGESRLELLAEIQGDSGDAVAMLIMGRDGSELAHTAMELGAYGYIIKPFERDELLINISNALHRRRLEIDARSQRERLEEIVRSRTAELELAIRMVERREESLRLSRQETIERLSIAAEFRDDEAPAHLERISRYSYLIAGWAGLDDQACDRLRVASIMHDVGKIGIPDRVLLNQGKLSDEEYELMKQHCEFGHRILSGSSSDLLDLAATVAYTHHEKWDGSGYPRALSMEEIPPEGRIVAMADVFDALTTDRTYRQAYDMEHATAILRFERGTHFDPDVLDPFLEHLPEILAAKEDVEAARKVPAE